MITEGFFSCLFGIVYELISYIPEFIVNIPDWFVETVKIIRIGLGIFPTDVFVICVGNGCFWLTAQFSYSILEWLWKKIPGVK